MAIGKKFPKRKPVNQAIICFCKAYGCSTASRRDGFCGPHYTAQYQWSIQSKIKAFFYSAKKHNQIISIDLERIKMLMGQKCFYCQKSTYSKTGYGIDRLDSTKGYVNGNVVPCCARCNFLKSDSIPFPAMFEIVDILRKYE